MRLKPSEELDEHGVSEAHIDTYVELLTQWPELTHHELKAFLPNVDYIYRHPLAMRRLAEAKMEELSKARKAGEEIRQRELILKDKYAAAEYKAIQNLLEFLDSDDDRVRWNATKESIKGVQSAAVKMNELKAEIEAKEKASESGIKIDSDDKDL